MLLFAARGGLAEALREFCRRHFDGLAKLKPAHRFTAAQECLTDWKLKPGKDARSSHERALREAWDEVKRQRV